MAKEIEIKFGLDDEKEMIRKLESLGAKKVSEGLEHNECFANERIKEEGFLLRLRQYGGRNVMTFKKKVSKGEFKEREEIETGFGDFQKMKDILSNLGYETFWVYEKNRTKFILDGTGVFVDRFPFATFMEIEGTEAGIRKVIEKLGLDLSKGTNKNIYEIYTEHCKKTGEEVRNLVFWKRAR